MDASFSYMHAIMLDKNIYSGVDLHIYQLFIIITIENCMFDVTKIESSSIHEGYSLMHCLVVS